MAAMANKEVSIARIEFPAQQNNRKCKHRSECNDGAVDAAFHAGRTQPLRLLRLKCHAQRDREFIALGYVVNVPLVVVLGVNEALD
jgi:hypothetical protein